MRSSFAIIIAASNFSRLFCFSIPVPLTNCRISPFQSNVRRSAARPLSMSKSSEFQQPKISTRIQATDDPCIVMMQVTDQLTSSCIFLTYPHTLYAENDARKGGHLIPGTGSPLTPNLMCSLRIRAFIPNRTSC